MYETQVSDINALEAEALAKLNQWNTKKAELIASAQAAAVSAALAASNAGTPSPPAPPAPSPSATLMANPVYNNGVFSSSAYATTAALFGSEGGVAYKYGPDPTYYGTNSVTMPTLYKNPDGNLDVISENNPANDDINNCRQCFIGMCGTWQVGGPPLPGQGGSYSSNQGQVMFIPDNPNAATHQGGIGVADLITLSVGENIVTTRSELPWMYYGEGLDSRNQVYYKSQGLNTTKPVCEGRGEGRPGWGMGTLVAYRDGLIGMSGHNTGNNKAFVQLGANKVPTSIAVTNSHEFAFVTVWDTAANKGQVAILALAGIPEGADPFGDPAQWGDYRGEWRGLFPGMSNYGCIGYIKLLGFFDLPSDMKCPTSSSATLAWNLTDYSPFEGSFDLRDAATRTRLRSGDRAFMIPKSCVLVVGSKEEKKVAFYDCAQLIRTIYDGYLAPGGFPTVGDGVGQWPPTLAANSGMTPTLIKTVDMGDRVTAVKMTRYADNKRAYIATQGGMLHIFNLGNYPALPGAGTPSTLVKVGEVVVGRNPTYIGTIPQHAGDGGYSGVQGLPYYGTKVYPDADFNREVIVTCRGDRRVEWVRFNSGYTGGAVIRTVQDSRLIDPIVAEDNANHTTESYVLTVSDYTGKQVISYRYGPAIFHWHEGVMSDDPNNPLSFDWTACLPPNGQAPVPTTHGGVTYNIECGGQFPLPGKPFDITTANVF